MQVLDQRGQLTRQKVLVDVRLVANLVAPGVVQDVDRDRLEPAGVLVADRADRAQADGPVDNEIAAAGLPGYLEWLRQPDLFDRGLQAFFELLGAPGPTEFRD